MSFNFNPNLRRRIITRINFIFILVSIAFMQVSASNDARKITLSTNKTTSPKIFKNQPLSYSIKNQIVVVNEKPIGVKEPLAQLAETTIIQEFVVTGVVKDTTGQVLPGVTVTLKTNKKIGTTTDGNGRYSLSIPKGSTLVFSMVGFEPSETKADKAILNIVLLDTQDALGEVVITAFGQKSRREDVVGAITSINPSDLKIPSSNLTNALAGRAAGIIGFQRSGEPGADNADFFIRGVTSFGYSVEPLILIDNVESTKDDLARLQVDDIENFSILKDATAAAVYGARGANGVLLITTKEGRRENMTVNLRAENSLSMATKDVEVTDPITYMKLANEALVGRDPLTRSPYSQNQIEFTPQGGSLEFPAVDWRNELLNKTAMNQRYNLSVRGGGAIARYYVAASLAQDNGVLKVPGNSNFNNNVNLKTYTLRSNTNIDLTKSTELKVMVNGVFDDYIGPLQSGSQVYLNIMRAIPTRFQPYYPPGENYKYVKHIMFGNADEGDYMNPYADMVKGYREYNNTNITAQVEVNQNLDVLTEGLTATARLATTRYSHYTINRTYKPFYYQLNGQDDSGNNLYKPYNEATGTEYLDYSQGGTKVNSGISMQAIVNYTRKFGEHALNGMLIGTMSSLLTGNPTTLQLSLPHRNLNIAGRFSYGYLGKYNIEANFGYNGSERFSEKHRFGFFPSMGLSWNVSKEDFFESLKPAISNLKLRATYGLVGNDRIGQDFERFYYLSDVDMNAGAWTFGPSGQETLNGIAVRRYPNNEITWETAYKANFGLELGLFNNAFEIQADYFTETRKNIFMSRADIPATMGLSAGIQANLGQVKASGFDMSTTYTKSYYNSLWIQGMLNFTYSTNKRTVYEEPFYNEPWLYAAGFPVRQAKGYIAERLFIDAQDVRNSPTQELGGEVIAGDIKYVDVNNDGKINTLDRVPLGFPTVPEINYGFGMSGGFKGFDVSFMFTGLARESFFINAASVSPFRRYTYPTRVINPDAISGNFQNHVLKVFADNHWSVDNPDSYALFPRLSWLTGNPNNEVQSTWWMRNGAFLRLKQVEMGYTFNGENGPLSRLGIGKLRVYTNASNLWTLTSFKLWDVEMGEFGMKYPIQKVFNMGVKVDF